jgi:hypothetical protein
MSAIPPEGPAEEYPELESESEELAVDSDARPVTSNGHQ